MHFPMHLSISRDAPKKQNSMHTRLFASQIARCTSLSTREPGRHGEEGNETTHAKEKPMVVIQAVSDNTKSKEPRGNRHLRSWRMREEVLFRKISRKGDDDEKDKLQGPV